MPGVGGLSTPQAAPLMQAALARKLGRSPTPAELQSALCISRFDGGYGAWPAGSSMEGSKNMGGVQCNAGSSGGPGYHCVPFGTWEVLQGRKVQLTIPFRYYDTWEGAVADFVDQITAPKRPRTQAALASGSLAQLAANMHLERYFTADPGDYARALWAQATPIARMLGVPLAVRLDGPASSSSGGWPLLLVAGAVLVAWEFGVFD